MDKKLLFLILAVVAIVLAPIVWYLASPLFIDQVVDEELPFEAPPAVKEEEVKVVEAQSQPEEIVEEQAPPEPVVEEPASEPSVSKSSTFSGADAGHQVSGDVSVLSQGDQRFLRFEDFKSTNGPDLKVYLSTDTEASDYVSLGELKGNIGNQNYELPSDVDLEKYNTVLIWCERFSVLFGHAVLN